MKPLKWKRFKRKIKRFWREWGITLCDGIYLLEAILLIVGVLCMPIIAEFIAAFI